MTLRLPSTLAKMRQDVCSKIPTKCELIDRKFWYMTLRLCTLQLVGVHSGNSDSDRLFKRNSQPHLDLSPSMIGKNLMEIMGEPNADILATKCRATGRAISSHRDCQKSDSHILLIS